MTYEPRAILLTTRLSLALIFVYALLGCGNFYDPFKSRGNDNGENGENWREHPQPGNLPEVSLELSYFRNCAEIRESVHTRMAKRRVIDLPIDDYSRTSIDDAANMPESVNAEDSGSESTSFTNIQEQGVDEADHTKIAENHIYRVIPIHPHNNIAVIDRKTLGTIGTITVKYMDQIKIFAIKDRLVVTGSPVILEQDRIKYEPGFATPYEPSFAAPDVYSRGLNQVKILIYQVEEGQLPRLLKSFTKEGSLRDARLYGDDLVISTSLSIDRPVFDNLGAPEPMDLTSTYSQASAYPDVFQSSPDKTQLLGIDCRNFVKPAIEDFDFSITTLHAIDISSAKSGNSLGFLGTGQNGSLYMTTKHIYLSKNGITWNYHTDQKKLQALRETLVLYQITLQHNDGPALDLSAIGSVQGKPYGQWAFKEYAEQDALAVFTTTGSSWDEEIRNQNHLYILQAEDHQLNIIGSVKNFGTDETIRSIRFSSSDNKHLAYAVTFRETDPLFAFDLTNLKKPQLLGELKIPGYSSYLHPLTKKRLLGIGYSDIGLQISLFDIKDPSKLKRLDVLEDNQSSEAQSNHHAFFYNAEYAIFALPTRTSYYFDQVAKDQSRGSKGNGMRFYSFKEDKIEQIALIDHNDLCQSDCSAKGVDRVFMVDGQLLTISDSGIKILDPQNPGVVLKSKPF